MLNKIRKFLQDMYGYPAYDEWEQGRMVQLNKRPCRLYKAGIDWEFNKTEWLIGFSWVYDGIGTLRRLEIKLYIPMMQIRLWVRSYNRHFT